MNTDEPFRIRQMVLLPQHNKIIFNFLLYSSRGNITEVSEIIPTTVIVTISCN